MKRVKGVLGTYENLLGAGGEHHAEGTQGTRRIKATPGEPIYRNGKIVRRVKESGIAYLKDDEYESISQMFFELGNIGYVEELERLNYYIDFYDAEIEKCRVKTDKMSPFCKKMGFLIGLLVCIVLI